MFFTKKKYVKPIASIILSSFLLQLLIPSIALAVTNGPSSPEFSKFQSVNTSGMVNEFSGAFSYGIPVISVPGPNGSGYSMSLSYQSGVSPEEDASWVGYGWTLNPGSITRNKRGIPDDYKGETITKWTKNRPNITYTFSPQVGPEVFSFEFVEGMKVGGNLSFRYNNQKGLSLVYGLGANLFGAASLNVNYDIQNGMSWSLEPSLRFINNMITENVQSLCDVKDKDSDIGNFARFISDHAGTAVSSLTSYTNNYVQNHLSGSHFPSYNAPFRGSSHTFKYGSIVEASPGVGGEIGGSLRYSKEENVTNSPLQSYGFLYSGEVVDKSHALMDYYLEKNHPYNPRDEYLPIPFANPDNYMVSGEGIGGGFRAFSKRAGHFRPASSHSYTNINSFGIDDHKGTPMGFPLVGTGVSMNLIGYHEYDVGQWLPWGAKGFYNFSTNNSLDEAFYFKFANDMGGVNDFRPNKGNVLSDFQAKAAPLSSLVSLPVLGSDQYKYQSTWGRVGRSSYIGYHAKKDLQSIAEKSILAFDPQNAKKFASADNDIKDHSIVEFEITNKNGVDYTYGLPVYARSERDISVNYVKVPKPTSKIVEYNIYPSGNIENNEVIQGEERNAPYVSNYLLTNIKSPDYVDITMDGPTPDDLGGYTKFDYKKAYGTKDSDNKMDPNPEEWRTGNTITNDWYKWRSPYQGAIYSDNALSDGKDDMVHVSMGEKEVYYLDKIQTKTHIAYFVTNKSNFTIKQHTNTGNIIDYDIKGSLKERKDAFEANHNDRDACNQISSTNQENDLEYLEKIILFPIVQNSVNGENDLIVGEEIQTTHLEYDYSSWPNTINSKKIQPGEARYNSSFPDRRHGKLTLKKVWFEYGKTKSDKISPYFFTYANTKKDFPSTYSHIENIYNSIPVINSSDANGGQSPIYNEDITDAWGNYRKYKSNRLKERFPWVEQVNDDDFDPAAWQLKEITLPSGGEILVSYEQKTYSKVQDRPAMVMENLSKYDEGGHMRINLDDHNLSNQEIKDYYEQLKKYFLNGNQKKNIYFKFLYRIMNESAIHYATTVERCHGEYIDGYCSIDNIHLITGGSKDYIEIEISKDGDILPRKKCKEYYQANRNGIFTPGANDCNCEEINIDGLKPWLIPGLFIKTSLDLFCKSVINEKSYLRIPAYKMKKGGGIRVKYLLMHDKFNSLAESGSSGAPLLYGTEYIYEDKNKHISYGVATNEPNGLGYENALKYVIKGRKSQNWYQDIVAGIDLQQYIGPIGESILPGASVGHSKVVTKNIFSGGTSNGFRISEYYTAKDFPFDGTNEIENLGTINYTSSTTLNKSVVENLFLPLGVLVVSKDQLNTSQGYMFIKNNMHGQQRRIGTYGGIFEDTLSWYTSSSAEYEYFQPGEQIPVSSKHIDQFSTETYFKKSNPGLDMDVCFESKELDDETLQVNVHPDFSFWFVTVYVTIVPSVVPIPIPSLSAGYSQTKNVLRSHVSSAVMTFPAVVKSIKTSKDGIETVAENLVFDSNTGECILSRTSDEYHDLELNNGKHDGWYYNYSFPASHYYSSMGQKSKYENYKVKTSRITGVLKINGCEPDFNAEFPTHYLHIDLKYSPYMDVFTKGDLLQLDASSSTPDNNTEYYRVLHVHGNMLTVSPLNIPNIYTPKLYSNTSNYSKPVTIKIIKSGRTNQLGAKAGQIASYGASSSEYQGFPATSLSKIVDALEIKRREKVVASINTAVNQVCDQNVGDVIDINSSVFDENLMVYDKNGEPYPIKQCEIKVRLNKKPTPYVVNGKTEFTPAIFEILVTRNTMTSSNNPSCSDVDICSIEYAKCKFRHNIFELSESARQIVCDGSRNHGITKWDEDISGDNKVPIPPKENKTELKTYHSYMMCQKISEEEAKNHFVINDVIPDSWGTSLKCLEFVDNARNSYILGSGVISASANEFSDEWDYNELDYYSSDGNFDKKDHYSIGKRGKWRVKNSYVYKNDIRNKDNTGQNGVYESGFMSTFRVFNWEYPKGNKISLTDMTKSDDDKWVHTNEVTKYTPNGEAIETKNILDIYSTSKYGYNNAVPSIVAANAKNEEIGFESFEMHNELQYGFVVGSNSLSSTQAHSGKRALIHSNDFEIRIPKLSKQVATEGLQIKMWISNKNPKSAWMFENQKIEPVFDIQTSTGSIDLQNVRLISRVGKWFLIEIPITKDLVPLNEGDSFEIIFKRNVLADNDYLLIDDIRYAPMTAQANCYVYNAKNMILLASFDDQHFGLFYQYNGEGKLTRNIKETMRGRKTISEANYNTPKVVRTASSPPPMQQIKEKINQEYLDEMKNKTSNTFKLNRDPNESTNNNKFDLIDVKIDSDKQDVKVIGIGKDSLKIPTHSEDIVPGFSKPKLDKSILKNMKQSMPDSSSIHLNKKLDIEKKLDLKIDSSKVKTIFKEKMNQNKSIHIKR